MKVLFANKYFYIKGGAENSMFVTADLLKSNAHETAFFSMKDDKNFPCKFSDYFVPKIDYYEDKGIINKITTALRILYYFEGKKKFAKLINDFNPDLIHFNNIYHQLSPSLIHSAKKRNVPMVMSLRDYKLVCASYSMVVNGKSCEACSHGKYYHCTLKKCVKNSRVKSLLNTIEMYLHHKIMHIYNLIDVFISPSLFLKEKVASMGFKGKIVHIPNCVDTAQFKPFFKNTENSICYIGRLSHEKGILTLVKAMKGVPSTLKILGKGPLQTDIQKLIEKENIDNVKLLGFQNSENLKKEVSNSKFSVISSEWYENNPRSVIESFALGKPVIGARIGGIPELVKDDQTGYTYMSGDKDDLNSKINMLLSSPEKIKTFGLNARRFVENELSSEVHYERLFRVYKSIL